MQSVVEHGKSAEGYTSFGLPRTEKKKAAKESKFPTNSANTTNSHRGYKGS